MVKCFLSYIITRSAKVKSNSHLVSESLGYSHRVRKNPHSFLGSRQAFVKGSDTISALLKVTYMKETLESHSPLKTMPAPFPSPADNAAGAEGAVQGKSTCLAYTEAQGSIPTTVKE